MPSRNISHPEGGSQAGDETQTSKTPLPPGIREKFQSGAQAISSRIARP